MAYVNVELEAEAVLDAMAEDGNFALDMWRLIAIRSDMGALKDDAADLMAGLSRAEAYAIARCIEDLAAAMKNGWDMSHADEPA